MFVNADWQGDVEAVERAANEPDMTMLNAEKKGKGDRGRWKTDCERGGGRANEVTRSKRKKKSQNTTVSECLSRRQS